MFAENKTLENTWFYFFVILVVHAALLLVFTTTSAPEFTKLFGAQKFLSDSGTAYLAAFAICFSGAFLVGSRFGAQLLQAFVARGSGILGGGWLKALILGCACLVIVGHLALFSVGHSVMHNLEGATDAKQEVAMTGTGAPLFLMALTPLFGALVGYALFGDPSRRARLVAFGAGLVVLGFVGVRFLFFERLPLFELGLPIAWFLLRRVRARKLFALAIVVAVLFFGLFSVAEYFRSWPSYVSNGLYQNTPGDFLEFIFYRVLGYYVTPVNHLNMLAREHFGHATQGFYTFRFALNSPVVGGLLSNSVPAFHAMTVKSDGVWIFLLDPQYGLNPEFNLFGFYGIAFLDWGWGGLVLAVVFGGAGGALLTAAKRGVTLGVLGFPIFLIGLAECPRLLYWSHERVFLSIIAVGLIALFLPWTTSRGEAEGELGP